MNYSGEAAKSHPIIQYMRKEALRHSILSLCDGLKMQAWRVPMNEPSDAPRRRGRPPTPPELQMTKEARIMTRQDWYDAWVAEAISQEIKVSEWIRRVLNEAAGVP